MTALQKLLLKAIDGCWIYSIRNDGGINLYGYFYNAEEGADGDSRKTWRMLETRDLPFTLWRHLNELNDYPLFRSYVRCVHSLTPEEAAMMFVGGIGNKKQTPLPRLMSDDSRTAADGQLFVDAVFVPSLDGTDDSLSPGKISSGYQEYYRILVKRFRETGLCTSADELIAIMRNCSDVEAKAAADAFRQSCLEMKYLFSHYYIDTALAFRNKRRSYPVNSVEHHVYDIAFDCFNRHPLNPKPILF